MPRLQDKTRYWDLTVVLRGAFMVEECSGHTLEVTFFAKLVFVSTISTRATLRFTRNAYSRKNPKQARSARL